MSEQHTPEPWSQTADQFAHIIIDAEGNEIVVIRNKANARRIVACVNACAGISTDALERHGSKTYALIDAHLNTVTKQRDDLLAALERIECLPERYPQDPIACANNAILIAEVAIDSVKGGAA